MTDKKFTDEEIIKGLNKLSSYTGFQEKHIQVLNAALDLINRQKAEIEQWQEEANRWQTLFCQEIHNKEEIEAEAYKEFAEKLKEKIGDCHIVSDGEYCGFDCGDIHRCIDNFLKEMYKHEHFIDLLSVEIVPYKKNKKILLINFKVKLYAKK